jgi:WD40 repeat protein
LLVHLWNVADPAHPAAVARLTGDTGAIHPAAFSSDGRTLVTAGSDRYLRLWDVTDPAHPVALGRLSGHTQTVRAIAFSPDGKSLATAGDDQTIIRWSLDVDAAVDRICAAVAPLTREEWKHTCQISCRSPRRAR